MPAASYREGPDGHSSRKQNSKRRRAKCSPSFVSGRVIGHGDIPPRCVPECSAMALHRAVPRCSSQPRQHSVFRTSDRGGRSPSPAFGAVFFCGEGGSYLVRGESRRSSMARSSRMRSRATGSGNILARCVPGRSTMAKCSRDAFPSVRRWQDCALMRSWPDWQRQYSRAMRSQVPCRGKISPRCVPGRQSVAIFSLYVSQKGPRTGKSPLPGKIRTPCIRNELALARYARYVSEKPRKPPSEDTPREDLARKGPFSLHGPLESCIVRRSCHPPPNSASDRNHGAALMARQPA